jgi:predicted membrane chloride channel (bestrophin family)
VKAALRRKAASFDNTSESASTALNDLPEPFGAVPVVESKVPFAYSIIVLFIWLYCLLVCQIVTVRCDLTQPYSAKFVFK